MESGEKEMRQVFEEVTNRNVKATVDHANLSRKLVRDLEKKVQLLENKLLSYEDRLEQIRLSLVNLQAKMYEATR